VRPTSSVLQTLGDWLVVSLGAFAGILVLVEVGFRIEVGTEFSVACRVAFIGFVLLFASFAAIPSRRIAHFSFWWLSLQQNCSFGGRTVDRGTKPSLPH
jgi:hypothetical protein